MNAVLCDGACLNMILLGSRVRRKSFNFLSVLVVVYRIAIEEISIDNV